MRLAGRIKGGFYPTAPSVLDGVARCVRPPDTTEVRDDAGARRPVPFTILDPCAGDGRALRMFKRHWWQATTYGIELDGERRDRLATAADHALGGDAFQAVLGHGQASLLFLNPPYDVSAGTLRRDGTTGRPERTELAFLQRFLPTLASGGVLVYLVPCGLVTEALLPRLTRRLTRIRVWRSAAAEYERFEQVVLLAQRRPQPVEPDPETCTALRRVLARPDDLPELDAAIVGSARDGGFEPYAVPPSDGITPFRLAQVSAEESMRLAARSPLWAQLAPARGLAPRAGDGLAVRGVPPIPLDGGMLALTVAAGVIHGSVGTPDAPHLIRGSVQRVMSTRVEPTYTQDGERTGEVTTETYRYLPVVHTLDAAGVVRNLSSGDALAGTVIHEDEARAANA